jgi:hypothetical protein
VSGYSIGVGLLASSLPSGATATTLDTASIGTPDLSTPVVPGQPDEDDDDDDDEGTRKDVDGDGVVTIDDKFARVAKKHPGFGGMFIDAEKDTIYVFLLDGDLDAVVKELKRVFGEDTLPQSKAKALKAKYSFSQLKEWHDQIVRQVFGIRGMTLTDIDDGENRLTVGVENEETKAKVEKQLKKLDIPDAAINIEVTGPVILDQCNVDALTDHCRPLVGGLQIVPDIPEPGFCTLGFNAILTNLNVRGFVTNSHCSPMQNRDDDTVYYQPTPLGPDGQIEDDRQIGQEFRDRSPDIPCFFELFNCRLSDSSFVEFRAADPEPDDPPSETPQEITDRLGFIARPDFGYRPPAILEDAAPPWDGVSTFRIVAEDEVVKGDIVTKVGRTTGITEGEVRRVGVANFEVDIRPLFQAPDKLLVNQVDVNFRGGDEGDSGGPVIKVQAGPPDQSGAIPATLVGIYWGRLEPGFGTTHFMFSPIQGVEDDLRSPLNTCAPSEPPC